MPEGTEINVVDVPMSSSLEGGAVLVPGYMPSGGDTMGSEAWH